MHWKSDWLLASVVSPAFLLANASDALQCLKRKAYDWSASVAPRDADITDINPTAASISQFPIQSAIPNNSSNQLNALIVKAKTNADELKKRVVKVVKV
jgi:hypothetical protein